MKEKTTEKEGEEKQNLLKQKERIKTTEKRRRER